MSVVGAAVACRVHILACRPVIMLILLGQCQDCLMSKDSWLRLLTKQVTEEMNSRSVLWNAPAMWLKQTQACSTAVAHETACAASADVNKAWIQFISTTQIVYTIECCCRSRKEMLHRIVIF